MPAAPLHLIAAPTNRAGLTTLFCERAEPRCPRHDVPVDSEYWSCMVCICEEERARDAWERERRVSELAEALRRVLPGVGK